MARRKNGRGAVFQRADGRWEGQLRLPRGGRKCFYGRTRREAARRLEQGGWMLAQGLPVSSGNKTVADFLSDWLAVTRRRVRPSTFENYELNSRRLDAQLGGVPIGRLSPPAIQAVYRNLQDSGLSPYSVPQAHRTLYRALNQAFHWGLIQHNPAALVYPPRPRRREMTALTPEQLHLLLTRTGGDRLHALWVVLGTAGLRVGEALGLSWTDVDLAQGRVVVRRTLRRQRGAGLVFGSPKTSGSYRMVILTELAVAALRLHRTCQQLEAGAKEWQEKGLVFASSSGRPLEPATPGKELNRVLREAGLPHVRVHDLRHTTASALLVAGAHPKLVQDLLGHRTIRTTMDTYSHVYPPLHADAVKLLDALLLGLGDPPGPRADREALPPLRLGRRSGDGMVKN